MASSMGPKRWSASAIHSKGLPLSAPEVAGAASKAFSRSSAAGGEFAGGEVLVGLEEPADPLLGFAQEQWGAVAGEDFGAQVLGGERRAADLGHEEGLGILVVADLKLVGGALPTGP